MKNIITDLKKLAKNLQEKDLTEESKSVDKLITEEIRNKFADQAHKSWSGWMDYLFNKSTENPDGSVTIPKTLVERWKRQLNTKYEDLSQKEQDSDLKEADQYLNLLK